MLNRIILLTFVCLTILSCGTEDGSISKNALSASVEPLSEVEDENESSGYSLRQRSYIKTEEGILKGVWSPDGKSLLTTNNGFMGLTIFDMEGNLSHTIEGDRIGYGACWSEDGNKIYYREKENYLLKVMSYNLKSKEINDEPHLDPSNIKGSEKAKAEGNFYVYTSHKGLKIEAKNPNTNKVWIITPGEGQFYEPILSPDQSQVLVHNGSKMEIYDAKGKGLLKQIGNGIATNWFPNGKEILFFMDESTDGHSISNSDIYIANIETDEIINLTNTEGKIEMYPNLSPDGKKVLYTETTTGKLIISELTQ